MLYKNSIDLVDTLGIMKNKYLMDFINNLDLNRKVL